MDVTRQNPLAEGLSKGQFPKSVAALSGLRQRRGERAEFWRYRGEADRGRHAGYNSMPKNVRPKFRARLGNLWVTGGLSAEFECASKTQRQTLC